MKTKIIIPAVFILILALIWGCEKEYDNVIENQYSTYQIISVEVKNLLQVPTNSLQYPIDSIAIFSAKFNKSVDIKNVNLDLYSPENVKLNSGIQLLDNGKVANGDAFANDDIYSAKINLDSNMINGNYELKLFVTDRLDVTKQVATTNYNYNNGKNNVAPVISDDLIDPDTVTVDSTVVIWTTIKAFDENGQNDISKVYFVVYKPDGSTNNIQLEMYDDGNISEHGDLVNGDGFYSLLISVNQSNAKGTYRFEFRAKDRSNKLSNIINHSVLIQ
jgi:hypothetical protein